MMELTTEYTEGHRRYFIFWVFRTKNAYFWCFCVSKFVLNDAKLVQYDAKVRLKYAKVVHNGAKVWPKLPASEITKARERKLPDATPTFFVHPIGRLAPPRFCNWL